MPSFLHSLPGLLFLTLCYAALCAASPFGTCRKCKGWGAKVSVGRFSRRLKRGPVCRRCDGHGQRLRLGRHLYNALSGLRREGTR
ncbi:hypothetical protein [Streptomyces sp. NPDC058045]|uniref:hypothetical protein n=1 Tax=Streptomyces sp. NPDC058045 TaxID=3346311 RepID=UPI0036F070A0